MSQPTPDIDIEYWDYDDGSVGARIAAAPEGDIWAETETTLFAGIGHVIDGVDTVEQAARAAGDKTSTRMLTSLGMQGMWIDGRFTVRFLPVKGFGVTFDTEDGLRTWLNTFVRLAVRKWAPNARPSAFVAREDDLPYLSSHPFQPNRQQRRSSRRSSLN